jgi:hypothetical protein
MKTHKTGLIKNETARKGDLIHPLTSLSVNMRAFSNKETCRSPSALYVLTRRASLSCGGVDEGANVLRGRGGAG